MSTSKPPPTSSTKNPLTHVPEELIHQLRVSQNKTKTNNQQIQKPDSAWHFKRQRSKLKHLTDQPTTFNISSIGTKDVSYLANAEDYKRKADISRVDKITDSLLPKEYHIVKTKAVVGLEYQDEAFTTRLQQLPVDKQAEIRLRTFPSLKPAKRNDAIQLLRILDDMLEDAGLDKDSKPSTPESQSQDRAVGQSKSEIDVCQDMKGIVKIIEKEQKIYNLVMHELIRQVTIECVERGELLAKLRDRYANLIGSIPSYMESIYNKSLALQAMEKRLAFKLVGFKDRVEQLASELSSVQQKEREASGETVRARRDLDDAVKEARRSADLLHEYQALYEMQRERLEKSVMLTTEERDLWTKVAYSLALKVIDVNSLTNCKTIQVSQTAWTQLARYFVGSLLKDNDSKDFDQIANLLLNFTESSREVANDIIINEQKSFKEFSKALDLFQGNLQILEGSTVIVEHSEEHGVLKTVHAPTDGGKSFFTNFVKHARPLEDLVEKEIEKRAGEAFISYTEKLKNLEKQRDDISMIANTVFHRHREAFHHGKEDSATTHSENILEALNSKFKILTDWYMSRINGENGISNRLTLLQSALEKLLRRNVNGRLSDLEWLQFHTDLNKWISVLKEIVSILESSLVRDHKVESIEENGGYEKINVEDLIEQENSESDNEECDIHVQTDEKPEPKTPENDFQLQNKINSKEIGLLGFIVNINEWAENSKVALNTNVKSLLVRVDSMNTELMKWLSSYLIECAPQQISGQPELEPGCDQATEVFVTTGLAKRDGMGSLLNEANSICLMMNSLTEGIRLSVRPILSRLLAEDSSNEALQDDMKKIETFINHCENWSDVTGNMLSNCFGLKIDLMKCDVKDVLSNVNILDIENTDSQTEILGGKGNKAYANQDEKEYADLVDRTNSIQAISFDGNVHSLSLQKIKESKEKVSMPMSEKTEGSFEVLNSVEQLQKQLNESEGLIHETERRCTELLGVGGVKYNEEKNKIEEKNLSYFTSPPPYTKKC